MRPSASQVRLMLLGIVLNGAVVVGSFALDLRPLPADGGLGLTATGAAMFAVSALGVLLLAAGLTLWVIAVSRR